MSQSCQCTPGYSQYANVTVVVTGSGFLFGSLIRFLINEIEELIQEYNQIETTIQVPKSSKVSATITPPSTDTTHCTVKLHIVPLTNVVAYVKLGTIVNPTSVVKIKGNVESVSFQCLGCPFPT